MDLEFAHAKLKFRLKTSIMIIIGEQSSEQPFALFLGLYPSWSFYVPETLSINITNNKIKLGKDVAC